MTRRSGPTSTIAAGLLLALLAAGCVGVQPSQRSAAVGAASSAADPTPAPATGDWPPRWGDGEFGKGVIVPLEGPLRAWRPVRLGEHHHLRPDETTELAAMLLAGKRRGDRGYSYRPERGGAYIFQRRPDTAAEGAEPGVGEPFEVFAFASGRVIGREAGGGPRVDLERTWFAAYDQAAGFERPRGLIVLLAGMFGEPRPVIDGMVADFQRAGWAVLRSMAPPAMASEKARLVLDAADPRGSAERAAALLTDRIAEYAYAARAAVEHTLRLRPGLDGVPTAAIGMSAGGIGLPAVIAWDEGRYDAAVFIGAGGNALEIAERTSYADLIDGLRVAWLGDAPGEDARRVLAGAYLAAAPLDPANAAARMRGLPTLVVQGSVDTAVPRETGDLLWERLGKPERWILPFDHGLLFLTLGFQTDRLLGWLEEHTPRPGDGERGG